MQYNGYIITTFQITDIIIIIIIVAFHSYLIANPVHDWDHILSVRIATVLSGLYARYVCQITREAVTLAVMAHGKSDRYNSISLMQLRFVHAS